MHRILVVDDESAIRQSLKGVLEDEGYDAHVAKPVDADELGTVLSRIAPLVA